MCAPSSLMDKQIYKTMPTTGHRPRRVVGDATLRAIITLKHLQMSVMETGKNVHHSTFSRTLYKAGLYARLVRRKPLLKHDHLQDFGATCLNYPIKTWLKGEAEKIRFWFENIMSGVYKWPHNGEVWWWQQHIKMIWNHFTVQGLEICPGETAYINQEVSICLLFHDYYPNIYCLWTMYCMFYRPGCGCKVFQMYVFSDRR